MNRTHGSCRGSWDIKMLRHESETWILQRILRYIWMLIYGSGDMDLAEVPEIQKSWDVNAKTWIGHMDLAEDPEIRRCWDMNPKTWTYYIRIRRHGSCRGSWDTYGCWDMNPETWISQRILRYIWMFIYGSGDMDLAEEPEIHMDAYIRIRRHGSCRGAWDTKMPRHEPKDVDLVEDPY